MKQFVLARINKRDLTQFPANENARRDLRRRAFCIFSDTRIRATKRRLQAVLLLTELASFDLQAAIAFLFRRQLWSLHS